MAKSASPLTEEVGIPDELFNEDFIQVTGANEHNLKNINVAIPRDKLVVVTGISGSGKSSLACDTIYAEGQRRYMETFSAYARQFIGEMERPEVEQITGLSPVISIEQKTTGRNPRSTVGTVTEVYDFLRLLYARIGEAYSYETGKKMVSYTEEQILGRFFLISKTAKYRYSLHWYVAVKGITASFLSRCASKATPRCGSTEKSPILRQVYKSIAIKYTILSW